MRKRFLLCGLMAIAAVNFISCDDEDENNDKKVENKTNSNSNGGTTTPKLSGEFVSSSDCLGSPWDHETTRAGMYGSSISYKFDESKGELDLTFKRSVLECASIPMVDFEFSGDTIIYMPYNADTSGVHADCMCVYDIAAKVKGVQSKVYYIRPKTMFEEDQLQVLELSQKSEGEL